MACDLQGPLTNEQSNAVTYMLNKNTYRYASGGAGDGAYDVPKPTDDVDVILPTPRDNVVEEEDSTALAVVQ